MNLHSAESLSQLSLGDERKKQIAIVPNIERTEQTYLPLAITHLRFRPSLPVHRCDAFLGRYVSLVDNSQTFERQVRRNFLDKL